MKNAIDAILQKSDCMYLAWMGGHMTMQNTQNVTGLDMDPTAALTRCCV